MLLVNIHELDIILADPSVVVGLKDEVDDVGRVLSLDGEDVIAAGSAKHLCERAQVDTEGNVAVAAEGVKGFGLEHHGDEGDVGVVHGLQRDARVIAVEVAVLNKVFDGIDNLLCRQKRLVLFAGEVYLLQHVGLVQACFKH